MQRRGFLAYLAGVPLIGAVMAMKAPSIFAKTVRQTDRKLNFNGEPHRELALAQPVPFWVLEDREALHHHVETIRLTMIEALKSAGAPINVWRLGRMNGAVSSPVNPYTGEPVPWKDEHWFRLRTRASVEREPFSDIFVHQATYMENPHA